MPAESRAWRSQPAKNGSYDFRDLRRDSQPDTIGLFRRTAKRAILAAIVPVASIAVWIGPIPAKVRRWPRGYVSNSSDGDQSAERDTRDDRSIVRSRSPGSTVPIWPACPAYWTAPRGRSPPSRPAAPAGIGMWGVAASPIRRPVMDVGTALSAAALGALDEGSRRIRCGMRCVN